VSGRSYDVAVVGATGAVGGEVVRILDERLFPIGDLRLFASLESVGIGVEVGGRELGVEPLGPRAFAGIDLAFFCAGAAVSAEYAPQAVAAGAVVVDTSARFRTDPLVPLVVPEVNAAALACREGGIVASPTGATIALVVALGPIAGAAGLCRVVASTYEAVSGAGKRGIETLSRETVNVLNMRSPSGEEDEAVFAHRIAFNCIPQVDELLADGSTREEEAVIAGTRKVLGLDALPLAITCVRVPTFYGSAVALTVETERALAPDEARAVLRAAPGIILCEAGDEMPYPTCADVGGTDAVYVGRVRADPAQPHGLQLWVALDNVRKGAALNAVQIAEILTRES